MSSRPTERFATHARLKKWRSGFHATRPSSWGSSNLQKMKAIRWRRKERKSPKMSKMWRNRSYRRSHIRTRMMTRLRRRRKCKRTQLLMVRGKRHRLQPSRGPALSQRRLKRRKMKIKPRKMKTATITQTMKRMKKAKIPSLKL